MEIPADGLLVDSCDLTVDESAITGKLYIKFLNYLYNISLLK